MKALRRHRHQMTLILRTIYRRKKETTIIIIMIYPMAVNHVHDMQNQREWRNENESLVRIHMNGNLNMAKRRMIERNLKGVVHEFIFSAKGWNGVYCIELGLKGIHLDNSNTREIQIQLTAFPTIISSS